MNYIDYIEKMEVGNYIDKPFGYMISVCIFIVIVYIVKGIVETVNGKYYKIELDMLADLGQFVGYFVFLVLIYVAFFKSGFRIEKMSIFNYFSVFFCTMEMIRFISKTFIFSMVCFICSILTPFKNSKY